MAWWPCPRPRPDCDSEEGAAPRYNITVNAIAPGFFPSKMTKWTLEQIGDTAIAQTPLARLGGEEDLKGLATLFASDASAHITGQIVDGGASII